MIRLENLLRLNALPHQRPNGAPGVVAASGWLALCLAFGTQHLLSQPASQSSAGPAPGALPTIKLLTQAPSKPSGVGALADSPTTNLPPTQLVTNLLTLGVSRGALSPEKADLWKQTLKVLVAKGPAAIPAIQDFLFRKQDVVFDAPGARELVGTPSLRFALLGALDEIGGPEAIAAAQKTLQTTADPAELVVLAKFLERAEPGKHRAEFARAAKETLALAASGNWDGRDVASLFEMMRTFGGSAELAELERYANVWFNYAAITIAHWPDGAGVPLLIKLAQNTNGALTIGQGACQRMLAEVALNSAAAADVLVELTRTEKIEIISWPSIGRGLEGQTMHLAAFNFNPPPVAVSQPDTRSYHLAYGNQNLMEASLPAAAPVKVVGDRVRLVDRLLNATTNPPAIDALQAAHIALAARLPKTN